MASFGAKTTTKEELQQVLRLPGGSKIAYESVGLMNLEFSVRHKFIDIHCKTSWEKSILPKFFFPLKELKAVRVANRIFVSNDIELNPPYQKILNYTFSTRALQLDFKNRNRAAQLINMWSRIATYGLINKIVDPCELFSSWYNFYLRFNLFFFRSWIGQQHETYARQFHLFLGWMEGAIWPKGYTWSEILRKSQLVEICTDDVSKRRIQSWKAFPNGRYIHSTSLSGKVEFKFLVYSCFHSFPKKILVIWVKTSTRIE